MSLYGTLGWTLLALLFTCALVGVSVKAPALMALAMTAVLILFSSSTWGQLTVDKNIYSRGTGVFYFSLLNLILFGAGVGLLLRKLANPHQPQLAPSMGLYFSGFALLMLAHLAAGTWAGVPLGSTLAYTGIVNLLNMMIFMYLLLGAFKSETEGRRLMHFIILLAAARAVFGLARFLWFDGDSANPYRNFERLDIKIFFFDIADNFIASLTAFWAAWLLTSPGAKLSRLKKMALLALLLLEVAAVALSFRRASMLGLALMFGFLLYRLPPSRRMAFMLLAGALLAASAAVMFQQRLQYTSQGASNIFSALVHDILPGAGGQSGAGTGRLYELMAAARSLGDNWLFGLGSWGTFTGDQEILSYHFGRFDFVHSGFGHIFFKAGLVGLLLFCGLLGAWIAHYFRRCAGLRGEARLWSDLGFAGLLFWLPTLLIGTPVIEFRSMLMIGLALALPFLAIRLQPSRRIAHAHP